MFFIQGDNCLEFSSALKVETFVKQYKGIK
jgi:hypothetical protein